MAQTGSGTVEDFMKWIGDAHYLPKRAEGEDNDNYIVYWEDPESSSDEGVGLEIRYSSSYGQMGVGAGEGMNDTDFRYLNYDNQYWSQHDNDEGYTRTDSADWWYESGTDWFWAVLSWEQSAGDYSHKYMAWQDVDRIWDYGTTINASRIATFAQGDDWDTWVSIDTAGGGAFDTSQNTNNFGATTGMLIQDNEWYVQEPTYVGQTWDGRSLVGEVDAWGYDPQQSSPNHLVTLSCPNKDWQYIAPRNEDPQYFFRIA